MSGQVANATVKIQAKAKVRTAASLLSMATRGRLKTGLFSLLTVVIIDPKRLLAKMIALVLACTPRLALAELTNFIRNRVSKLSSKGQFIGLFVASRITACGSSRALIKAQ